MCIELNKKFENKELNLKYKFTQRAAPLQAVGDVNGYKFYFKARIKNCYFTVLDDHSDFSDPAAITNKDDGFYIKFDADENELSFDDAKKLVEQGAKEFLEYQQESKYKYQNRIVAFVDIIGFKDLVYSSSEVKLKEVLLALEELQYEFIEHKNTEFQVMWRDLFFDDIEMAGDLYHTQVHQISDCIIISKLAHRPGSLEDLVLDCSLVIHLLIKHGLLCRGSISYGKTLHDSNHIVGPAYIKAYEGEEKEFLPAVSFSQEVYNLTKSYTSKNEKHQDYFKHCIVEHTDDNYFIDYFNDYGLFIDVNSKYEDHYNKLKSIIEVGYKNSRSYKIKAKYLWMIEQFNNSKAVKNEILNSIKK